VIPSGASRSVIPFEFGKERNHQIGNDETELCGLRWRSKSTCGPVRLINSAPANTVEDALPRLQCLISSWFRRAFETVTIGHLQSRAIPSC